MDTFWIAQIRKLARMQRQATIVAGLAAKRPDGRIEPASIVRDARMIDAEILKQAEAEGE